jgi:hypothetical protein
MTREESEYVVEGKRYVALQQAKIEAQRLFIQDLESAGRDAGIVKIENETLSEMIKSLDLVLHRLRPIIDRIGVRSEHN